MTLIALLFSKEFLMIQKNFFKTISILESLAALDINLRQTKSTTFLLMNVELM